jgi:hypothetical protein
MAAAAAAVRSATNVTPPGDVSGGRSVGQDRHWAVVLPTEGALAVGPASEDDGHLDDVHVVDQPLGEELTQDRRAATDADIEAASGRARTLKDLLRVPVDEVEDVPPSISIEVRGWWVITNTGV